MNPTAPQTAALVFSSWSDVPVWAWIISGATLVGGVYALYEHYQDQKRKYKRSKEIISEADRVIRETQKACADAEATMEEVKRQQDDLYEQGQLQVHENPDDSHARKALLEGNTRQGNTP